MDILNNLFLLGNEKDKNFISKLIPNLNKDFFIGIKIPILKKYAIELIKNNEYTIFINDLPHKYYEENMLHALILSNLKDFDEALALIDNFLSYIDNWAVCDSLIPKSFKNNEIIVETKIKEWITSKETYRIRFGLKCLMTYFLDDKYKIEYLELPLKIKTDEYYVKMMIAWLYATSLSKRYEDTIEILEFKRLEKWIHNKTIRKAIESYKIDNDKKEYLRSLTIK